MSRLWVELDMCRIQYQVNGLNFSMCRVMKLNNINRKVSYVTGSYAPESAREVRVVHVIGIFDNY
jgi:hypothetical protein